MIVKIWPVKGVQGLKKSKLYIEDENKVIKVDFDEDGSFQSRSEINTREQFHMDADRYFIEYEEDVDRVIEYIANEDKIKSKYISGYQCDPDIALEDFQVTWNTLFCQSPSHKTPKNMERETLSFHMVQSFPEDLDISDEEVHECGIELLKKLEKHQGIVCSHVHPVVDETGEVHGKCKHNHILFNAYIQPDKIDPAAPNRLKYHDCKETYAQLRIWNDEIAIDHGLPIIRNPDEERTYSWYENYETKAGRSWKERVRLDIEFARRATSNWNEFLDFMIQNGYQIRDSAHVTYTTPDGAHKVRGDTLGTAYTKEKLELYWTIRDRVEHAVDQAVRDNAAPPLWTVAQDHGQLTVDIPLGIQGEGTRPSYSLPLTKDDRNRAVLSTYFNDKDLYDIRDKSGKVIASATGRELVDYLDALRRGDDSRWAEQQRQQREDQERQNQWQKDEENRRKKDEEQQKKTYTAPFRNSRTRRPYYADLRDENGRRRSSLELLFLLAIVVLKSEDGLWDKNPAPDGRENEAVFGPTDWKIQNMMDSIHVAAEEGLETPAQLDQRLHESGAALSRARAALRKTKRAQEKMEALAKALDVYEDTRELAEQIHALPDGPEKENLQERYREVIERYKGAKAVMHGYQVTTLTEIADFQRRYEDIQSNLPVMEERLDQTKEEYRRLKKLQYNVSLAQNEQYCYGPDYDIEKERIRDKRERQ